ncbi:MAG: glycosyltransferase [Acidobacteria bacterium]|nr:glycosyltransferase [Acidobacteriota bacterium]
MKPFSIELSRPLPTIDGPPGAEAWLLVRLHGAPLGYLKPRLGDTPLTPAALAALILERHMWPIVRHLVADGVALPDLAGLRLDDLPRECPPSTNGPPPLVTVAVCTRNRTASLADCLDALERLDYPALDLLVVDNAPWTDGTARLVRDRFPRIRYTLEPRPGLNWARNRAVLEARGEIVAYTDDDVIVDEGWAAALARTFGEEPDAMAVTGLVVPDELQTAAQSLFERYGGFGRGFERRYYQVDAEMGERAAVRHGGAGRFGTGANMAFRRSLFDRAGLFDPALDVGTPTNGGGDLEMFFRVLKTGHLLIYEPRAIVRHRHRRDYEQLRTQIANNGIGLYAYLVRSALTYRDERAALLRLAVWWLWWWNVRRLLISFVRPGRFPRDLIIAELRGSLVGLTRYARARRRVREIVATFGHQAAIEGDAS